MDASMILHVTPQAAATLSDELARCTGVTPVCAQRSSLDGTLPEVVIAVFAAKEAIRLARDVILKYVDSKVIRSIKMGDFEAQFATRESAEKLYNLFLQAQSGSADATRSSVDVDPS